MKDKNTVQRPATRKETHGLTASLCLLICCQDLSACCDLPCFLIPVSPYASTSLTSRGDHWANVGEGTIGKWQTQEAEGPGAWAWGSSLVLGKDKKKVQWCQRTAVTRVAAHRWTMTRIEKGSHTMTTSSDTLSSNGVCQLILTVSVVGLRDFWRDDWILGRLYDVHGWLRC